jgi:hypothetical protein
MAIDPPQLQFGGSGTHSDPKVGLEIAGPFDLRFQSARKTEVRVGLIGPRHWMDKAEMWLQRCAESIRRIVPLAQAISRARCFEENDNGD